MIQVRVICAWKEDKKEDYLRLLKWIEESDDSVRWENPLRCATWINGTVYPIYLELAGEEELMLCKLLFPKLISV